MKEDSIYLRNIEISKGITKEDVISLRNSDRYYQRKNSQNCQKNLINRCSVMKTLFDQSLER